MVVAGEDTMTEADPPSGFAQGRLFGDENQKSKGNSQGNRRSFDFAQDDRVFG